MRFAVASDDGNTIANHTGRCQCFVVFDVENQLLNPVEVRTNRFTAHALGQCDSSQEQAPGHEHHSHNSLLDALHDCQALLCRGMGPRLVRDLQSHNITPVFCRESEVAAAAQRYARGELLPGQINQCSHT
jgi:predicted Fe-Mo cluster-binding NifX family protein